MKIKLSSESTCDLPKELLEKYDISTIPYSVILGDEIVEDNETVPAKIYEFVETTKKLPKTSAINEETYKEYFESLLKDNDAVIHITLSSGLSSSNSHAVAAAESLKNVYVIDSKSLSTGIALLCIYARKLIDEGNSPETIVEKVTARVPHVQASFVVERLDYLYKGGRCSRLALFGANLLKIRPQIVVKDGVMSPDKKFRGKMEMVVSKYCEETLSEFNTPDKSIAFVTHTSATPEMVNNAIEAVKNAGFENVYDTVAGGTITSHCGEHVLGILYFNDGDQI
jgi:DegV family protein with EDD domain